MRVLVSDGDAFYNSFKKEGFNIVSLPQLILDLLEEGSVCEEAAKMLICKGQEYFRKKKTCIKPK